MKKLKKSIRKAPPKAAADEVTEEIVRLVASSMAALSPKERLAAMKEFDEAARELSANKKKTARRRKRS